ncbi:hypothetical protein, partial [Shewanella indica]|uniref:hypothetical protein n=1 Tax=Shewanella indica TaxID=768528 RepID=UPI003005B5B1
MKMVESPPVREIFFSLYTSLLTPPVPAYNPPVNHHNNCSSITVLMLGDVTGVVDQIIRLNATAPRLS